MLRKRPAIRARSEGRTHEARPEVSSCLAAVSGTQRSVLKTKCGLAHTHDLVVFAGKQQHANRGTFMRFPHIPIQSFKIEPQFTKVLRLKSAHLQFPGYQAVQSAMEEEQIDCEVSTANLQGDTGSRQNRSRGPIDQKVLQLSRRAEASLLLNGLAASRETRRLRRPERCSERRDTFVSPPATLLAA